MAARRIKHALGNSRYFNYAHRFFFPVPEDAHVVSGAASELFNNGYKMKKVLIRF